MTPALLEHFQQKGKAGLRSEMTKKQMDKALQTIRFRNPGI